MTPEEAKKIALEVALSLAPADAVQLLKSAKLIEAYLLGETK